MGLFDKLKPKYKNSDPNVRRNAIWELTDQKIIEDIAKNDEDEYVRRKAVAKLATLTNQEDVFIDIAKNDEDWGVRYEAVEQIKNEDALIDIAKNDEYDTVRGKATKGISNSKVLEDIVKNDSSSSVRWDILKTTSNQEIIKYIAKNDESEYNREIAVGKLQDISILEDIAKNDENEEVRERASKKLEKLTPSTENIIKNTIESVGGSVTSQSGVNNSYKKKKKNGAPDERYDAILRIKDDNILKDVALAQLNGNIRAFTINQITTKSILIELSKYRDPQEDTNPDFRDINNENPYEVGRNIAKKRLKELGYD